MKLEEFYPIIRVLGEIFNNKLSPEATEIYYRLLGKYPIQELKDASMKILETYKYNCMPKPVDFIDIIKENRKRREMYQGNEPLQLYQEPTQEQLDKIRELVRGVVNKCKKTQGGDDK